MPRPPFLLTCFAVALVALPIGCSSGRGYPDQTPDTARRVDDVRRNAADQKDAIATQERSDRERFDFREEQIRSKHESARDEATLAYDREVAERAAQRREIELHADNEKQRLIVEARDRKRLSGSDQTTAIAADLASASAKADAEAAEDLEPLTKADNDALAKLDQRLLEIDREEAQELIALEQERATARNQARAKRIEVDRWTSSELAQVEQQSRPETDRNRDDERMK